MDDVARTPGGLDTTDMNCYYCKQPIEDGMPYLPIAYTSEPQDGDVMPHGELQPHEWADLACAFTNTRTVPATPDKSGKWCDYHHPPTGRYCMLTPHGEDVAHELEAKR